MASFDNNLFDVFSSNDTNGKDRRAGAAPDELTETEELHPSEPLSKRPRLEVADERSSCESRGLPSVIEVDTIEACTHEVALPPGYSYRPLVQKTTKPAKEYRFILDPFQKEALKCIENGQSVLVSAHTSAGKTVVAEYAVAVSLRDKQRVIYTTPIKALSNQKYRELYEDVQDVGLMTGDVTINPSASVLVMTTEILRSMLYRGSEVMREVGWVIFDEIHYMRDKERGVVWEEAIILLPDNIHYVFLSATIPNARQFAQWVAVLHKQPCHVVYTDFRPTPLQHYLFPAGADGLYLVVNEKNEFLEDNFQTAMSVLKEGAGGQHNRRSGTKGPSNIYKVVKMVMERGLQPVIIFSFSKRECEAYALQLSRLDLNSDEEKRLVDEVFANAIDSLSDEDKHIPQIEHVLPLLRRGVGIHHGGLLPILKETVEILFSEGLIKALFATETFALGLNMPARTVVFSSARKFDGKEFRWVTGGEYIQMSGRAGRRGLDEKGIVMLMVDEKMEPSVGKTLVKGTPDPLNSAFRLTYNMVLNLLRVEEINPEYMLEKSFYQFQNSTTIADKEEKLCQLEQEYKSTVFVDEEDVTSYYLTYQQLQKYQKELQAIITKPCYLLPYMQPGRLVKVHHEDDDFGWGAVVNFQKKVMSRKTGGAEDAVLYIAEVMLLCSSESCQNSATSLPSPCPPGDVGEMQVVPVTFPLITAVSSVRVYLPKDLRPAVNRQTLLTSIQEVRKRFPRGLPLLDVKDMNIHGEGAERLVKKTRTLGERLHAHRLHNNPNLDRLFNECKQKMEMAAEIKSLKKELKVAQTILHLDELKARKRVLRRLGYASPSDVIELKGRVACEISAADELVLTELIFNGAFTNLSVAQMTALMSCFIFDEKVKEVPELSPELKSAHEILKKTCRYVGDVIIESKIELDAEAYMQSFKSDMMAVVFAWCKGAQFSQICKMTSTFEGSIIRCFRRLEELLRQMAQAAKVIGNEKLSEKFLTGINQVKRDIVFAASLYL